MSSLFPRAASLPGARARRLSAALLALALPLAAAPNAGAASAYGHQAMVYLNTAFNYNAIAYNNAPVGTGGMMHKVANSTCIQCHASMNNAPSGNSFAFEAYLYSFYAAQLATAAYNADVAGNSAAARTYYNAAYTYGHAAYVYGATSYQGQFFNSTGATDAYRGYYYSGLGQAYAFYASQGK
jgi:hypothetical protein